MARLPSSFNSDEHGEMQDFEAIPAGEYQAKIKESEMVKNKKETGSYLKLTFEVTAGDYRGRLLWSNLNLDHPSEQAVEIAQKELATICRAVGKSAIDDSNELHGIDMLVKVTVKAANPNYPASNVIRNYKPLPGLARPTAPGGSGGAAATPSNPGVAKPAPPKKPLVSFDD